MVFKTGIWGEQAKQRSKKRNEYFKSYRRKHKKANVRPRKIITTENKNKKIKVGNIGELIAISFLSGSKLVGKPCDIEWNNYKIDVKTSKPISIKLKIKGKKYSYIGWRYSIKRQRKIADFYFIVRLNNDETIIDMYLIPNNQLPKDEFTLLQSTIRKYEKYLLKGVRKI